jgi:RimJ/RimL family protein N-acetyltransferase
VQHLEGVMNIRSLRRIELYKYADHLLRLSAHDRYLRFSGSVSDQSIRDYVKSINLMEGAVKVICDDALQVVAAVHVLTFQDGHAAEIALSVEEGSRGLGYGRALFKSAVKWVKTRSIERIYSMCLRENGPMMHIASAQGMTLYHDSAETEAYLEIDKPTFFAYWEEILEEQFGWADYASKKLRSLSAIPKLGILRVTSPLQQPLSPKTSMPASHPDNI